MSDSHARWQRLAALLSDRRTRLDPQYKSRLKFAADTGLNERLIADLENARRSSYRSTTLGAVETAYRWAPGSIERVLAGGDPAEVVAVTGTAGVIMTRGSAGQIQAEDQPTEGIEAALRELARRLSPDRVRAVLEEVAPAQKGSGTPATERRYEDDADQHLWETPGLDERERRYLIHQLDALRRFDDATDRSEAERPSADVHEFRRRG